MMAFLNFLTRVHNGITSISTGAAGLGGRLAYLEYFVVAPVESDCTYGAMTRLNNRVK